MKICLWLLFVRICVCQGIHHNNIRIELHVFSGTRDPVWDITPSNPNFAAIERKRTQASTPLASRLGYSGFTLTFMEGEHTRSVTVGKCKDMELETLLMNTVKDLVPLGGIPIGTSVVEYVQRELDSC